MSIKDIKDKLNGLAEGLITISANAFLDFKEGLHDVNRMNMCKNEIAMLSSGTFCHAFDDVAYRICSTRTAKTADTYCALADEAVKKLAKGESESDVIWYFEKLLMKERGEIK